MAQRVCPFIFGYWLACPVRRLVHKPEKIVEPYVTSGMNVLEVGPAMGFFSLPMARMVGVSGKVICVDVEARMLRVLEKRARKAGLTDIIVTRTCTADSLCVGDYEGKIDFALLFAVVHEIPEVGKLFGEVARALKAGGKCLVAEPRGHVKEKAFRETPALAERQGFELGGEPRVRWSRAAELRKKQSQPRAAEAQ